MTIPMSARLAWHMDGWNGHVCQNPEANTYCVGSHSYPGEMIAERRSLPLEMADAGKCCTKIKHIPACGYSINAFGSKKITAFAAPPAWWNDEAAREEWDLPPATMCVWPYEQMYGPKVTNPDGKFNYEKRLAFSRQYFAQFTPGQSLVFYYANYSNPLNQEEQRYAIVGLSRIKSIGKIRFFNRASQANKDKYAGGFVWQCDITSHYPDQGLRLPYHRYLNKPDVLEQFAFYSEIASSLSTEINHTRRGAKRARTKKASSGPSICKSYRRIAVSCLAPTISTRSSRSFCNPTRERHRARPCVLWTGSCCPTRSSRFATEPSLILSGRTISTLGRTRRYGEDWYWEHWGRMDEQKYRNHRAEKVEWYKKNFPDRLIETFEGKTLSADADKLIKNYFS